MDISFVELWHDLRANYWTLPLLMVGIAGVLSYVTYALDRKFAYQVGQAPMWLVDDDAEGARELVATVATSIMTVAGVAFSVMMVALTLAASRYGPQLLPNYLRDTGNQIVLGTFLATFTFALLILPSIRTEGEVFVPQISLSVVYLLTAASLVAFIYFINHAAQTVQVVPNLSRVHSTMTTLVDRLYPEPLAEGQTERCLEPDPAQMEEVPPSFLSESRVITSTDAGYIRLINAGRLEDVAQSEDLLIQVEVRPGEFVVDGAVVAWAWPATRVTEQVVERIQDAVPIDGERSPTQDILYPVRQLAEVAVQALSPGINDPFTAMTAIDWLGDGLCRVARRRMPSRYDHDEEGRLRVITDPVTFDEITSLAFDEIRLYA